MMNGMGRMCALHKVAWVLVLIGAINWGLIGIFQIDLVMKILGSWPMVVRVVYALVGLSGVAMLFCGKCKACKMEMK
jgi:uncharacterized membrane protein YuzA (DUF378 family)